MRFSFALIFLIMTSMATGWRLKMNTASAKRIIPISCGPTPKSKVSSVPIDGACNHTIEGRTFRAMLDNIDESAADAS